MTTTTADTIRAEMARRRLTQRELADAAGMSGSALNARLNGHTAITVQDLQKIARALDMSPAQLLDSA